MDKQRILVGIPTMSNRITIQVAGLLDALRTSAFDEECNVEFHFTIEHGKMPVEYARNVIVGTFLRSNCDKLWFIDEDMLPEQSVVRLIASTADITCARMFKFDNPNPEKGVTVGLGLVALKKTPQGLFTPLVIEPGSHAIQHCDAVGTACTIIQRHVLEDRRMWFPNEYTDERGNHIDGNVDSVTDDFAPNIFRTVRAPSGKQLYGEDIDFCMRAKDLGYSIMVDMNAVCGHYKQINIDQAGYLAQETVNRVLNGIHTSDGRLMKFGFEEPPAHRAVTRDFTVRK